MKKVSEFITKLKNPHVQNNPLKCPFYRPQKHFKDNTFV